MQIKQLSPKEKPLAKELWRNVFIEDTDAFIDFYFDEEFDDDIYFGMFEEERLVSMVGITAADIQFNGVTKSTFLFRGVATNAAYTGKGYASQLMIYAMSHLKSQEVPFVLLKTFIHPFYEKLGFATCSHTQDEQIAPKKLGLGLTHQIVDSFGQIEESLLESLYQLYIEFILDKNLFVVRTKKDFSQHLYEALDISKEQLIVLYKEGRPIAYSLCEETTSELYGEETIFSILEQLSFFAQIATDLKKDGFTYKNVMGAKTADAMCRVLHVKPMLKELLIAETTYVQVKDELFTDNDGIWKIAVYNGKKSICKMEANKTGAKVALVLGAGELCAYLLGKEAPPNIAHFFKGNRPHGIFEQY